MIIWP